MSSWHPRDVFCNNGQDSFQTKDPRPRTASFIATPEGVVFHNEDSDTSSEYPPSDSDDMVSTQEQDPDTTSEHFSPVGLGEEEENGLQTQLKELVHQLLMLTPYLDDPQRHHILVESCLQRATDLLHGMKHAFDQATRPAVLHCDVCIEDLPREQFPYEDVTDRCNHDKNICSACLSQSIAAQLDDKGWDQITCPTSSCAAKLSSGDVEMWTERHIVDRYHRFMIASTLDTDPDFRHCLREGCQFGQVHESGTEEPVMYCGECFFKMCFVHKRAWHEGQTCAEYDESLQSKARHLREESQSEAVIAETSKVCPGIGCETRIEKGEGCDHMTCTRCRHEFCWKCLAPYGPIKVLGNTAHNTGCPYSNPLLPPHALLNPTRYLNPTGR